MPMEEHSCIVMPTKAIGGEFRSYRGITQPFAAHVHEFYVIGRVEAGERTLELNGAHRHIARGSLIVLNPGDVHGCTQEGEEPFAYDCFMVSAALLDDARLSFPAKDEPGIQSAYDDALRALRAGSAEDAFEQVVFLASLLEIERSDAQHSIHEEAALRIHAHFREHLEKPMKISQLAAMEGLSEYALIRAYRRRFHITPLQHLMSLRIEYACGLLREGAPVADIAFETGFSDQAHLTRIFKQRIGTTPAAYQAMTCGKEHRP